MTTSTAPILAASEAAANGIAIDDAIASYRRNLRAENKSPNTIHTYLAALDAFTAYLKRTGMPTALTAIRREHLRPTSWPSRSRASGPPPCRSPIARCSPSSSGR